MKITQLDLAGVLLIELDVHHDDRGWFMEFWSAQRMSHPGMSAAFVQDNIAFSYRAVLRGLHFQAPQPQGKLVTVVAGDIYDVAVDVRPESATFGQWTAANLCAGRALYIPEGFAHGYQVTSASAFVLYKVTAPYHPGNEHCLAWNDPGLGIDWPIADAVVSAKDSQARTLTETRAALTGLPKA